MDLSAYQAVCDHLRTELAKTLVGPGAENEVLLDPPSRTYISGYLAMLDTEVEEDQIDELQEGDQEGSFEGIPALMNATRPSAMGLTCHVPDSVSVLLVTVSAGMYEVTNTDATTEEISRSEFGGVLAGLDDEPAAEGVSRSDGSEHTTRWRRRAHEVTVRMSIRDGDSSNSPFEREPGPISRLRLGAHVYRSGDEQLRSVTVTLVNGNTPPQNEAWKPENRDPRTVFQPRLLVEFADESEAGEFLSGPGVHTPGDDPDRAQHVLLYRHARNVATGHGCAVMWDPSDRVTRLWTEFVPHHVVPKLEYDLADEDARTLASMAPDSNASSVFLMENLAGARDDDSILSALDALCGAYDSWLQRAADGIEDAVSSIEDASVREYVREHAAEPNVRREGPGVLARMRAGVATLRADPVAFRCFRLANEAMHRQLERPIGHEGEPASLRPAWRPFQLAFLLMCLNSIANPEATVDGQTERERDIFDLIWFPTGGGKTEAYLGLMAFTLFHRRLRHDGDPDAGRGVAVLTRYTLRLLTTQQFDRATRLVCACEAMRIEGRDARGHKLCLGGERFTIGLWIGGSSTPNKFMDSRGRDPIPGAITLLARRRRAPGLSSGEADVWRVRSCPWCAARVDPSDMRVVDESGKEIRNDNHTRRGTRHRLIIECSGAGGRGADEPCPFHQREGIPVLLIDEEIYDYPPSVVIGTVDKFARLIWTSEAGALLGRAEITCSPPELIIQDELHLISGPLGSMVGAFEAAIDWIATDASGRKPKIVGSTATIRRASEQVRALYDRSLCQFPPPGLTANDGFFAREATHLAGRMYIGIMAPGVSGKQYFLRCCGALLQLVSELDDAVVDPYWTLVCYFNSLRALAGTQALVQDDVQFYIRALARIRTQLGMDFSPRDLAPPVEITSRTSASDIPQILTQLETARATDAPGCPVDVALATNMIGVGIDIDRLSLMMIRGQPKTTAEYIQASSRVGRRWPGVVVTLADWTRSRDRSHYERFLPYHQSLYREVETTSVTPWAPPARDRTLAASLVAMLRHTKPDLATDPTALLTLSPREKEEVVEYLSGRVRNQDPREADGAEREVWALLDEWERWAAAYENGKYGQGLHWGAGPDCLLRSMTALRGDRDGLFGAPNSMRSVEPQTPFALTWVRPDTGRGES